MLVEERGIDFDVKDDYLCKPRVVCIISLKHLNASSTERRRTRCRLRCRQRIGNATDV
jgi:hypothetical protein